MPTRRSQVQPAEASIFSRLVRHQHYTRIADNAESLNSQQRETKETTQQPRKAWIGQGAERQEGQAALAASLRPTLLSSLLTSPWRIPARKTHTHTSPQNKQTPTTHHYTLRLQTSKGAPPPFVLENLSPCAHGSQPAPPPLLGPCAFFLSLLSAHRHNERGRRTAWVRAAS